MTYYTLLLGLGRGILMDTDPLGWNAVSDRLLLNKPKPPWNVSVAVAVVYGNAIHHSPAEGYRQPRGVDGFLSRFGSTSLYYNYATLLPATTFIVPLPSIKLN